MATLKEYFLNDARSNTTLHEEWPIGDVNGRQFGNVIARLHFDFEANALFVSFYIPAMDEVACPEAIVLREVSKVLALRDKTAVSMGFSSDKHPSSDLVFTGQIYLYSERPVSAEDRERLHRESTTAGHRLSFRSVEYVESRSVAERPKAFISHDSRDKSEMAQPLARQLSSMLVPVWYDEFSLTVGDSLRESIERGLKECHRCILVITPNFLGNGGWSKREYDSIFTRELVEQKKLVLPIWRDVTPRDVYEYSPILADRVAANWSEGIDAVTRKIYQAIQSSE
ncbi:toll/interleukin-1 receptor domain-containing protein [Devosia sp. CN2-171]|uniref:toll/interleukin-1 receptor domain-containing protein n=1 Tax=Devosia sp. CN2-171 TaxID=3400909 RepID=UPI003BF8DFD3